MKQEHIHLPPENAGKTIALFAKNIFGAEKKILSRESFIDYFLKVFFFLIEEKTGFSRKTIQSPSRLRPIVYMRHSLANILYKNTDLSLYEAGKILGRDHSTIVHSLKPKRVKNSQEKLLSDYNMLNELFASCMEELLSNDALFAWCEKSVNPASPFVCKLNTWPLFVKATEQGNWEIYQSVNTKKMPTPASLRRVVRAAFIAKEFAAGVTLFELGKKYKRSSERMRQIIQMDKKQYLQLKKEHAEQKKLKTAIARKERLRTFIELIKKTGRIPDIEETRAHMVISRELHYNLLKHDAIKLGYASKFKYEKVERYEKKRFELMLHLKKTAAKIGYTPGVRELEASGKYWGASYIYYFGSLSKAQELAGLKPNHTSNSHERAVRNKLYASKHICIKELKSLRKKLGHKPRWEEVRRYCNYSVGIYRKRLGNSITDFVQYIYLKNKKRHTTEKRK